MEAWRRNLYWLASIQVLAGTAILGLISFVPLFVHELGVDDPGAAGMWSGLITGVTSFTAALANPYWGEYGDRKGHKRVLLQILFALTLVMVTMSFVRTPLELFILRGVQGMVGGFIAAGLSMVVIQTPKEYSTYALGTYQMGIVLGATLGPMLGGAAADIIGYRGTFIFFGLLTLCGGFLTKRYIYEDFEPKPQKQKESMWGNLKLFLSIPLVRLMMGIQFFVSFALMGIGPILPIYIKMMVGNTPTLATICGIILAVGGFSSALSAMNMGRITQWLSHRHILLSGTFLAGLFFIAQFFAPNIWVLGLFRALNGFCVGTLMPSANALIAANVPENKRGIAFGVTSSASLMGNVVGPIASGALALTFGLGSVFWSTAVVFFLICALVYIRLPISASQPQVRKI